MAHAREPVIATDTVELLHGCRVEGIMETLNLFLLAQSKELVIHQMGI